jgi:hypothetical protein
LVDVEEWVDRRIRPVDRCLSIAVDESLHLPQAFVRQRIPELAGHSDGPERGDIVHAAGGGCDRDFAAGPPARLMEARDEI